MKHIKEALVLVTVIIAVKTKGLGTLINFKMNLNVVVVTAKQQNARSVSQICESYIMCLVFVERIVGVLKNIVRKVTAERNGKSKIYLIPALIFNVSQEKPLKTVQLIVVTRTTHLLVHGRITRAWTNAVVNHPVALQNCRKHFKYRHTL